MDIKKFTANRAREISEIKNADIVTKYSQKIITEVLEKIEYEAAHGNRVYYHKTSEYPENKTLYKNIIRELKQLGYEVKYKYFWDYKEGQITVRW